MEACGLELPGKASVLWAQRAAAPPLGQLSWFLEFLHGCGLLMERWVRECPLRYLSPNAPGKQEVLGTWVLSVLSGHNRYRLRCRSRRQPSLCP